VDPAINRLDLRRNVVGMASIPVFLLAVAYAVFLVGDSFGPPTLDRGLFTLVVAVPLWLSAPVISGAMWRRWPDAASSGGAIVAAVVISVFATVAIWRFVALPDDCEYGPRPGAEALIAPAIAVGIVLGVLIARAALQARTVFRGGFSAVGALVAYGASAGASVLTIIAAVVLLGGAHCNSGS
jgi:hypothetical protein